MESCTRVPQMEHVAKVCLCVLQGGETPGVDLAVCPPAALRTRCLPTLDF